MADREGKVVRVRTEAPIDPAEEARQLAAYERARAKAEKAAAKAQEAADALREESLRANEELFRILNEEDYRDLSTTPRRRARELSLLILFQVVVGGCDWDTARRVLEDTNVTGENAVFALSLARRAQEDRERSDKWMSACAREWDVERFAQVDRLILWLGASELHRDTESQPSIIINEAVELAKKFGSDESAAFINGMLDSIYNKFIKKEDGASL